MRCRKNWIFHSDRNCDERGRLIDAMRQFERDDVLRAAAGDTDALLRVQRRKDILKWNALKQRIALQNATPSWADHEAIDAFYTEAKRLSAVTGTKHDVDHIIPLQGRPRESGTRRSKPAMNRFPTGTAERAGNSCSLRSYFLMETIVAFPPSCLKENDTRSPTISPANCFSVTEKAIVIGGHCTAGTAP